MSKKIKTTNLPNSQLEKTQSYNFEKSKKEFPRLSDISSNPTQPTTNNKNDMVGHKRDEIENNNNQISQDRKSSKTSESNPNQIIHPNGKLFYFPEVFLNGVNVNTTEQDIRDHFKNCNIKSIKFLTSKKGSTVRPKCFIKMMNQESITEAMKLNECVFLDQRINVIEVKPKLGEKKTKLDQMSETIESSTVLVRNIPETFNEQSLKDLFSEFGTCVSTRVVRETNGKSKRYAFVEFEDNVCAKKAICKSGENVDGCVIGVVLSVPKQNSQPVNDGKFRINRGNYFRKEEHDRITREKAEMKMRSEFQGEFYDL